MTAINKVKTYSIRSRPSRVSKADFAKPAVKGRSFSGFLSSLPNILKAKDLASVADAVVKARSLKKSVIFMAGAHVIKCGLNPVIIDLIKKKVITCVCLNGAGIIHDFELSLAAKTSEDVGENLKTGKFGMARETAEFLNGAIAEGVLEGLGVGEAVARKISREKLPHKNLSLLYNAYKYGVPVCIFVAIGTDIIHQHPSFDAGLTAEGSLRDFHKLISCVAGLNQAGVVLNFGSAVIMPEVFLKALNLARNLGNKVTDFTSANFDMIYHYRPQQNVVSRPVSSGGRGFYLIGHHELMLPLLAQSIAERL